MQQEQNIEREFKEKRLVVGGPVTFTLFQMAKLFNKSQGKTCLPIPLILIKVGLHFAKLLRLFRIGKDQITNLSLDNVTNKKQTYIKMKKFSIWINSLK